MGGGLLQLVAYGAQDVYLTGNPQITFFKVVYRRHTNFAMEAIQQTFSGNPDYGNTVYCQISRNGDLIHRTYLEVGIKSLSSATSYVNYLGLRLLKQVSIEIGGQQIDKHYSDWLYIWNELSLPIGKRFAWDTMVGADSDALNSAAYQTNGDGVTYLYIPLEFWFCRNIGLSLPLIALQYHEVKIKIDFETFANCTFKVGNPFTDGPDSADISKSLISPNLWVDYIYLDTDERRKFAQLSHEYLIEQLQFTGTETLNSTGSRIKLNFNHPCKELIWVAKIHKVNSQWYNYTRNTNNTAEPSTNETPYDNYKIPNLTFTSETTNSYLISSNIPNSSAITDNAALNKFIIDKVIPYDNSSIQSKYFNPFDTCLLQLNGNDRFNVRKGSYFNLVQPYQHHTNIPLNRGINVYSFALKPEEHQPSGTLNMSRIDTAILDLKPKSQTTNTPISGSVNIYAVNYNVLRILSGMGGLAYSN
jgi:Large eukaryotic DNA virus major capsid protein/Major capsid protein N-terminus